METRSRRLRGQPVPGRTVWRWEFRSSVLAAALTLALLNALEPLMIDDTAYFAYANRTVLGLGCSTEGDVLGLSPGASDDPEDWGHQ